MDSREPNHPADSEHHTVPSGEHEALSDFDDQAPQSTVSADIRPPAELESKLSAPFVPGHAPERRLGIGTYGQVWLYSENHSRRRVAIKFLKRQCSQQWQLLQAEVKQLAMLDGDPGIVQLRRVEPDNNPPYYVMTFAEGGSLVDRLANGPLAVDEAVRIFERVTQALAYVHAKGVRHCDLKPGNVLLDAMDRPLIADFGQAHIEGDAVPTLGTFFYMAPEQADLSEAVPDARWDVYSLGAIFFAMLVGRAPRWRTELRDALSQATNLQERLRLYREGVQSAPRLEDHRRLRGVDRALAEVVDRCLEVNPQRRYRDAGDVLRALEHRKQRRRHSLLSLLAVLPALLLLVLAFWARWIVRDSVRAVEQALTGPTSLSPSEKVAVIDGLKHRLWMVDVATMISLTIMLAVLIVWVALRRGKSYKSEKPDA